MNSDELAQLDGFEGNDPETRGMLRKMKEAERKPLNTRSMLETAFPKMKKLAAQVAKGGQVRFGKETVETGETSEGNASEYSDYEETGEAGETEDPGESSQKGPKQPSLYERTTIQISDLRDYLIHSFAAISNDNRVASVFTNCIRKTEDIMAKLGFELDENEKFNPIMHCSGLKQDNILKNAQQVLENTKTHYSTYEIVGTDVSEYKGHPAVSVKIQGTDDGKPFCVVGMVVAKSDFAGNEAIDYVRRGGQGVFSVKAARLGQWHNVSRDFSIGTKIISVEESQRPAQDSQPKEPATEVSSEEATKTP